MKNFSKPSDDPLNVERSMQMQTSLNATDQYYSNITSALSWMQTTDTTMGQLGTVLTNIRSDLVKAGAPGYTQDERDKINDEVRQYVSQFAQILNTNLGGEYIFGGTQGLSKPVTTTTDEAGNVSIEYADAEGNVVNSIPEVVSNGFSVGNWQDKSITFNLSSTAITLENTDNNIDDVVKDLNNKIQKSDLRDSITAVKTNDGNIKFLAVNSSDDIKISATTVVDDLSDAIGKQLSNVDMANIGADKTIEVSQGVVLDYNATASSVMQYGENNNNAINDDNVKALMNRIQHHLAGQVLDTTTEVAEGTTGAEKVVNSDGTVHYYAWKTDEDAAKNELTNQDLTDIDAASKGLLKVRSQIGAKEKRMEALQDQNKSSKLDIQETLSETEDIDLTQKTIEYSTMITVYQACLQTAAKVMQPTLMNYLS